MRVILDVLEGPRKGQSLVFEPGGPQVVGRSRSADCPIPEDVALSRDHFSLDVRANGCTLRDLESTNWTYVNDQRVGEVRLGTGDRIAAGSSLFRVRLDGLQADIETWDRPLRPVRNNHPGYDGVDPNGANAGEPFAPDDSGNAALTPLAIRCACCGSMAPPDLKLPDDVGDSGESVQWICELCHAEVASTPQPVPHYTAIRELGRGGMGVVLLARHNQTGQMVALKLIVPEGATARSMIDRFLREMSVISQLKHPHIVEWLEQGMTRGQFWFAMEYVEGTNLEKLAQANPGGYPIRQACRMACQVLKGLEHAHSHGFVHRDIKPENILIGRSKTGLVVKISDFGLAKSFRGFGLSGLTFSGEMRGTLPFMPPEQIKDFKTVLPSGDLYATAATLYFLLTGRYIYQDGVSNSSAIEVILESDPVPITQRRSDVSVELERILSKCLAREPDERYPNATAMRMALRPFC